MDTILSIQPKDSAGGEGETRESVVYKQAGEMLEKLPSDYIPHEVRARLNKMGAIAPMNIFLRQEIDRMQRVIAVVRSTLQDLQLAVDGTIIMSEVKISFASLLVKICSRGLINTTHASSQNLQDALDCIYDAKVPSTWSRVSATCMIEMLKLIDIAPYSTDILGLINDWFLVH